MKTFWAWKHDINSTHTNMSNYTKILARDITSAHRKAQKHYKYHMFNSNFNVSIMSGEKDEHGYAKECEYSTGQWTRKAYSAYKYFHSLDPDMQKRVYDHYRKLNEDWNTQDKKELRFIVALLKQENLS